MLAMLAGEVTNEMSRRLLVVNALLGLLCVAFAVGIVRSLFVKRPLPAAVVVHSFAAAPAALATQSAVGPETYASITTNPLFSPDRNETAPAAPVAVVKPILHGIVIEGATSRAFLEDPSVKRVTGYSVGDPVVGGNLLKIADDRVVISRPEGLIEVLLQDPAKPRPVPTAPPVATVVTGVGQPGPGPQGSLAGQLGPVQAAPAQTTVAPAGMASMQTTLTSAPDQVLGQVLPSGTLGNQPVAVPSQSRWRATAPGQ